MQPSGTVLFQGDSITDAFRKPEEVGDGYRLGMGYAFLVGSLLQATTGDPGLSVQNRGVAGNTAADLLLRWGRDCLELRPDTLSLLIGVNDAIRASAAGADAGAALAGFAPAFDALLAQVRARLPATGLVVLEPFSLPVDPLGAQRAAQLAPIREHVRHAAAAHGATLVALQDAFDAVAGTHPERWLFDGIHPTAAGQWLITQRWLQVVCGIELPAPR